MENKLDGLGNAHLSEVMGTMKEWRTLILEAQIEQKEHQRRIQNGD